MLTEPNEETSSSKSTPISTPTTSSTTSCSTDEEPPVLRRSARVPKPVQRYIEEIDYLRVRRLQLCSDSLNIFKYNSEGRTKTIKISIDGVNEIK